METRIVFVLLLLMSIEKLGFNRGFKSNET
jgi:hypothetical protein